MIKKFLIILAVFVGVVVALTMNTESDYLTGIGRRVPSLALKDAEREINIDRMRGEYVILNFWTSTDAASRADANMYCSWIEKHPGADVKLLSINFDKSEGLFKEIVRRDGLNPEEQFHADAAEAAEIRRSYALGKGYGSVLVNPQGRIVAHNPTAADLDRIFNG